MSTEIGFIYECETCGKKILRSQISGCKENKHDTITNCLNCVCFLCLTVDERQISYWRRIASAKEMIDELVERMQSEADAERARRKLEKANLTQSLQTPQLESQPQEEKALD